METIISNHNRLVKSMEESNKKEGKLIIFTAPSGAGKTTIVRHLLKTRTDLAFSISACTRSQRYGEVNGLDYYFMSVYDFQKKVGEGEFLEWQEVYENQYYGTLKEEVERLRMMGKNVIFDMDVKGAWNIKKIYKKKALTVFVKPPTPETLFERLKNRKTEDEASMRKRLARAKEELTYERRFDLSLVNDDLEIALAQAEHIVEDFIKNGIQKVV
ncbi:MAG: guanylate kinase [Saprospiraceae bacterium]|nr:guanylate kinase [Saprospiraceae bacterium]